MLRKKKAIRAVNNLDFNAHTSDSYLNMKMLKLEDFYKYKINVIMHYAVHNRGYNYLSRDFVLIPITVITKRIKYKRRNKLRCREYVRKNLRILFIMARDV